jgi:hypothetical protein
VKTARARFLTFVASSRSFAQTGTDATTNAAAILGGPFCGFDVIEFHCVLANFCSVLIYGQLLSFDAEQITHFIDHAAIRRRIDNSDGLMGFFQAQAVNACFVRLQATDDAFRQRHGDSFLRSHVVPLNAS